MSFGNGVLFCLGISCIVVSTQSSEIISAIIMTLVGTVAIVLSIAWEYEDRKR